MAQKQMKHSLHHTNGYVYTSVLPTATVISSRKCVGKFTSLELSLIFLSFFLFTLLLGLILTWVLVVSRDIRDSSAASEKSENLSSSHQRLVCDSPECTLIAAHFLQNIDTTVDPCEDFYRFACGRFAEFHELPTDKPFASLIQDIESRLYSRIRTVIEDNEATTKPKKLVKDLYTSCMDEAEIDSLGKQPLLDSFESLGGFPLLEPNWSDKNFSWERLAGTLLREQGVRLLIESYTTQNAQDSTHYIIEIDQQKLGLKTRKYYMNGTEDKLMQAYLEFIVETLVLFGAKRKEAEEQMMDIIRLEVDLAKISSPDESRRDRNKLYNARKLHEFKREFPDIDMNTYLKTGYPESLNITENETLVVLELDYLKNLAQVLNQYQKRTVANYIMWRLVQEYIDLLPESYQQPKERFKFYLLGISSKSAHWEECIKLTTTFLPMIVGSMYVEKYFNQDSKTEVHEMTNNLREAFIRNLRHLDWMDEQTRQKALEKAEIMVAKTGYPDYIFDDVRLLSEYDTVEVSTTRLFANVVNIRRTSSTKDLLKLRTNVDRELWFESPAVVDAYYAPSNNEIVFPAGILQFPFFTMGAPHYINYAMIGAVIGHEITHGFDDEGRQHDTNGNLHQWWDTATLEHFFEKADCLEEQYSGIEVPEIRKPLNGRLTLGENIADNGGVKTAYNAYRLWTQKHNFTEAALPGLYQFNADKMFFIAYANNWCGTMRPEAYEYFIAGEVHSPHKYRAVVPLQNFDKFSQAFNCPVDSYMNPSKKCSVCIILQQYHVVYYGMDGANFTNLLPEVVTRRMCPRQHKYL